MAQNDLAPSNVGGDDDSRKIEWPIVQARVHPDVFEQIEKKAEAAGQKVGVWAREVLNAAAESA